MWGVGRLQVHGICMYIEVVEAPSYLWWFRNPAYDDSTGNSRIEKNRVRVPPGLV